MPAFLSAEWLDAVDTALAEAEPLVDDGDLELAVRQRVTGGPAGDVTYVVRIGGGTARVETGPAAVGPVDVEVSASWPVAVAISQGSLAPAAAFGAGRLRLRGDVGIVSRHGEVLAHLARASASVSAATTY